MPSLSQKIAHNTLVQILGKILSTIIGLATVSLLTHYLGPAGFGQYTIIIAFLSFFGILVDMGIYLTTLQMISENERDSLKIFSNAFTLRIVFSVIFLSLAPLLSLLFPYEPIIKKGILIGVSTFLFISLCQLLHAVFQKELDMFLAELSEIIGKTVLLIAIIAAVMWKLDLLFIMICLGIGNFVFFLLKYLYARKFMKFYFAFDKQIWKEIIYKSWPIALSIIFNLIYLRGDTIILSLYATKSQIGFYGASYKVLDVLTTLPIIIAGLMLPLFAKAWKEKNFSDLRKFLQSSFDASAIIAIPIVLGTQFIALPVMTLVAGKDYAPSGPILQILIIAICVIFFSTMFNHFIVAINEQKTMLFGFLATALLSVIAYFMLIPRFFGIGAAWVTVFSEATIAVISWVIIKKKTKLNLNLDKFLKSLLAGVAMSAILYLAKQWNFLFLILLGAVVYAAALYMLGAVDKEFVFNLIKIKKENKLPEIDNPSNTTGI